MIKLIVNTVNNPPVLINPDHVVTVIPRRTVTPVDASQGLTTRNEYVGSVIELSTGARFNVIEDFAEVDALLRPAKAVGVPMQAPQDPVRAPAKGGKKNDRQEEPSSGDQADEAPQRG